MKRRKIGNPCFLCEKSLLDCDGNRPCSRCIAKNIPQMCLGIEISQLANQNYGGIKNEAKSTSFSQQKTTSIPPSNDSSQTKEIRTKQISSKTNFPLKNESPSIPNGKIEDHTPSQTKSKVEIIKDENNKEGTSSIQDKLEPSPSNQLSISNSWFMEELKRLKEEQRKLNEEILALKIQNMNLTNKLESSLLQTCTQPVYFSNFIDQSQKAMVVFDLTKNPAIVLTANDIFCKMLGYDMKEVLGAPWHKFIHPDYIERTKSILAQQNLNGSVITFEQVYLHKNGIFFTTLDTHTILFANGQPISDFVFITITGNKAPDPISRPFSSYPAITGPAPLQPSIYNNPNTNTNNNNNNNALVGPISTNSSNNFFPFGRPTLIPSPPQITPISEPTNTPIANVPQEFSQSAQEPQEQLEQPIIENNETFDFPEDLSNIDLDSFLNTIQSS